MASKLMGMGLLAMAASAVWRLNPTWHGNTIGISHGIIRNERYKGDALLQKSYIEDFPFKQKVNKGERDMYYVKNNNPAKCQITIYSHSLVCAIIRYVLFCGH